MSINQGNSNIVTTNQDGIHENLLDYLSRYSVDNYLRPIADFSVKDFNTILAFGKNSEVIFDLGCGVGESSFKLAKRYPSIKVIGIDKSLSRLERNNQFKREIPENLLLVRGELLDIIPLIYQNKSQFKIHSLYILYPNPYPKKHHIKRRFHANPVCVFIFGLDTQIILRSNWRLYLEEFEQAAIYFNRKRTELTEITTTEYLTPFEKKFVESLQKVYELNIY